MRELILIPGAPKSGTTFIHSLIISASAKIDSHAIIKEPLTLARRTELARNKFISNRLVSNYSDWFKNTSLNNCMNVDASQAYFSCEMDENMLGRVKDDFSRVIVLFILRDPLERLVSNYRMDLMNHWISPKLSIGNVLQEQLTIAPPLYGNGPRYFSESFYFRNIEKFSKIFGRESCYVMSSKELSAAKLAESLESMSCNSNIVRLVTQCADFKNTSLNKNEFTGEQVPKLLKKISELIPKSVRNSPEFEKYKKFFKQKMSTESLNVSTVLPAGPKYELIEDLSRLENEFDNICKNCIPKSEIASWLVKLKES